MAVWAKISLPSPERGELTKKKKYEVVAALSKSLFTFQDLEKLTLKTIKMSEFINIVPWFDSDEWHRVYKLIYSEDSSEECKVQALNLLRIWKARCPALPCGIESTLNLLQVHIQDLTTSNNVTYDQLYRLAYSSAIMRFVNHMLDAETAKGASFYKAANSLGVPDWIVDLRHDTAHSNNLPSIELLREACIISLEWLKINYWNKYTNVITNYVSSPKEIYKDHIKLRKIETLLNLCIHVNICTCSGSKIKNLADITDPGLKMSLAEDINEIFGNSVNLSNLKAVSMKSLENLIKTQCKKVFIVRNTSNYISQILLADDSLFLSLELLSCYDSACLTTNFKLPKPYLMCFENLLLLLHENELLQEFIFDLIKYTSNGVSHKKNLLASLWVSEILKAVKRLKQFKESAKKLTIVEISAMKRPELLSLFYHWFPNEHGIMLDLLKPIPKELTVITYIQPILSTYNPYLSYFVNDLLLLMDPALPKSTFKKICLLTQLITNPERFPFKSTVIHTLKPCSNGENQIDAEEMEVENHEEDQLNRVQDNVNPCATWCLASTIFSWSTCPIGQTP